MWHLVKVRQRQAKEVLWQESGRSLTCYDKEKAMWCGVFQMRRAKMRRLGNLLIFKGSTSVFCSCQRGAPAPERYWEAIVFYALCGVSSAGKTTILKEVLQREPGLSQVITSTTRSPRPGEVDHVDYHFVTDERFHAAVQAGQLVCPLCHREQWYATAPDDLCAQEDGDRIAVLRPDKIGELERWMRAPMVSIYITRPGFAHPATEDDRLCAASQSLCTYQVINWTGALDCAVDQVLAL